MYQFSFIFLTYRVSKDVRLLSLFFCIYILLRLSNSNVHQTTPRKPRMAFVLVPSLEFQAVTCNTCTPACSTIHVRCSWHEYRELLLPGRR